MGKGRWGVNDVKEGAALLQAVCDNPDDRDARKILADWYEENGHQDLSDCWRWSVDNHKRPYRLSSSLEKAAWFGISLRKIRMDPESDLPRDVARRLVLGKLKLRNDVGTERFYPDAASAWEDFVQAWLAARKEGGV